MKKKRVLLGLVLMACGASGSIHYRSQQVDVEPGRPLWSDPDMTFTLRQWAQKPGLKVVLLGDSITQRWLYYPEIWSKLEAFGPMANLGVGGDRIEDLIGRVRQGLLDESSPDLVIILIGTNNVGHREPNWWQHRRPTPAEIVSSIEVLVADVRERLPRAKVVVQTLLPRGAPDSYPRQRITAVNERLKYLADDQNILLLDWGSELLQANGSFKNGVTFDQLHLQGPGYEIWAQALTRFLSEL